MLSYRPKAVRVIKLKYSFSSITDIFHLQKQSPIPTNLVKNTLSEITPNATKFHCKFKPKTQKMQNLTISKMCYFASTATSKPLLTRSLALPDATALVCQRAFYNCLFSKIFCQIFSNISPVQFWFLRVKGVKTEVNGRRQQEDHRMAITTRKHTVCSSVFPGSPNFKWSAVPVVPNVTVTALQHPASQQLKANTPRLGSWQPTLQLLLSSECAPQRSARSPTSTCCGA